MKGYAKRVSALLAVIILSACVAIPENPADRTDARGERWLVRPSQCARKDG